MHFFSDIIISICPGNIPLYFCSLFLAIMFDLEVFVKAPTVEALSLATRDDLVRVAGHYKLEVRGNPSKREIQERVFGHLRELGVFGGESPQPSPERPGKPNPLPSPSKADLEFKRLQLREKEIAWEKEKLNLEAERQILCEREKREHELRMKDLEFQQALRIKELELKACESGALVRSDQFEVTRNIRVVPPFREDEVDKFFAHFERVATTLKLPREIWTMTLQCVFKGKAQEAYSTLSLKMQLITRKSSKLFYACTLLYQRLIDKSFAVIRKLKLLLMLSMSEKKKCFLIVGLILKK